MIRFLFIKVTMASTRRMDWWEMKAESGKPMRKQSQTSRGDMVMAWSRVVPLEVEKGWGMNIIIRQKKEDLVMDWLVEGIIIMVEIQDNTQVFVLSYYWCVVEPLSALTFSYWCSFLLKIHSFELLLSQDLSHCFYSSSCLLSVKRKKINIFSPERIVPLANVIEKWSSFFGYQPHMTSLSHMQCWLLEWFRTSSSYSDLIWMHCLLIISDTTYYPEFKTPSVPFQLMWRWVCALEWPSTARI